MSALPLSAEREAEIRAIRAASTQGTWFWLGNAECQNLQLAARLPMTPYVMGFRRWGMQGAQPTFPGETHMQPAQGLVKYRAHYSKDIVAIDHPNARLIAAARWDGRRVTGGAGSAPWRGRPNVSTFPVKPLGRKAYGHIGHLPASNLGPGDHTINEGQARIATVKVRDRHDRVIVQEKLDGSCVAVAKHDGRLLALGRAGHLAASSKWEQHHLFDQWVYANHARFDQLLDEGERIVGEWLAQAHGTRYDLTNREPFVPFDLMRGDKRACYDTLKQRIEERIGSDPLALAAVMTDCGAVSTDYLAHCLSYRDSDTRLYGYHGAIDPVEGAVWRVERLGEVLFLCKWVRPDFVPGRYMLDQDLIWNWRPV